MVKALGEYSSEELRAELALRSAEVGVPVTAAPLRLDLGCGKNKKPGFVGVDAMSFPGVDTVCDLGTARWPWPDASVDEVHASHFVEHLGPEARIYFANELHRVLKPGGTASIITPHWNSPRAFGDLTHAWPPVSEWWYLYLSAEWRKANAPHNTDYLCDFPPPVIGYSPNQGLCVGRNDEYVREAVAKWRGGADDMSATLVKPK